MEIKKIEDKKDTFVISMKNGTWQGEKFVYTRKDFIKRTLLTCSCSSLAHTLVVSEIDDDDNDLYIEVHLAYKGFWWRVWNAIRYIFKCQRNYGDFDEVILSDESKVKLMELLANNLIKGQEIKDKYDKVHGKKFEFDRQ